jgi:HAE1 family hydrophobic/amphiphilic exporter-1
MGVAVVGGMLTSTFLTLIIIPVVYTIFSDIADKFGWKQHLETTTGADAGSEAPASLKNT